MMSTTDFDLRLRHIDEQYAAKREGADAYRDQEMARLFEECGWTEEKIAARMGKKQQWVSRRLVFGRFLKFTPTGSNSPSGLTNLTERRFREYWKRTKGKEEDRFREVLNILETGIPQSLGAMVDKPGIRAAILATLEDGQWYTVAQILATVEESLVGVTTDQIARNLGHLRRQPPAGKRVETKSIGKKSQYRLVRAERAERAPEAAAVLSLYEAATPLIEEIEHWGRSSKWAQAPGELLKIATKLKRLFESRLVAEHA